MGILVVLFGSALVYFAFDCCSLLCSSASIAISWSILWTLVVSLSAPLIEKVLLFLFCLNYANKQRKHIPACVFWFFFHPTDPRNHHGKLYNSTQKCSDWPFLSLSLLTSKPVTRNFYAINKTLYMAFVHLEKAFYHVPRSVIFASYQ